MEHVCPGDWPGILRGFQQALKPGGWLYFTVDLAEGVDVAEAYERGKASGLPVVFGEVADPVDKAFEQIAALGMAAVPVRLADSAVYHFHPSLEQVRTWIGDVGMSIHHEGTGNGYAHFLARKRRVTNHACACGMGVLCVSAVAIFLLRVHGCEVEPVAGDRPGANMADRQGTLLEGIIRVRGGEL
jgi:hypothetical protein